MVYYRKYRPQKISDLDSEGVRRKLFSVLQVAAPTFLQTPHAFLFTGPKGLGKTSAARIVAKVINCEKVPEVSKVSEVSKGNKKRDGIEPCNECQQCVSITSGTNLDVFEIDAASNRGIDEIRDLKEKIRLAPVSAKKKVYIIDEVHMLTTEAFNALLKTLEEPPSHAVFILCTTEAHKVPSTILSRCLHIAFKSATDAELVRAFKRIAVGEGLTIDEQTLFEIAKLADGGFRDGTKILEELVSLSDSKEITAALLEKGYHVTSITQSIQKIIKASEEKNLQTSMTVVTEMVEAGTDMAYFLTELIEAFHSLLLARVGVGESLFTTQLDVDDIRLILAHLTKASGEMKYTVVPSLPLELALVSWCQGTQELRMKNEEIRIEKKESTQKEEVTVASMRKEAGNIAKQKALNGEDTTEKEKVVKSDPSEVSILKFAATGEHSAEWIASLWKNIIMEMKNHNHMIAGVLRSCRIVGYDRKVLTIEAAAIFHKEKLVEAKTFAVLLAVCEKLIGNPIEITIQLKA